MQSATGFELPTVDIRSFAYLGDRMLIRFQSHATGLFALSKDIKVKRVLFVDYVVTEITSTVSFEHFESDKLFDAATSVNESPMSISLPQMSTVFKSSHLR